MENKKKIYNLFLISFILLFSWTLCHAQESLIDQSQLVEDSNNGGVRWAYQTFIPEANNISGVTLGGMLTQCWNYPMLEICKGDLTGPEPSDSYGDDCGANNEQIHFIPLYCEYWNVGEFIENTFSFPPITVTPGDKYFLRIYGVHLYYGQPVHDSQTRLKLPMNSSGGYSEGYYTSSWGGADEGDLYFKTHYDPLHLVMTWPLDGVLDDREITLHFGDYDPRNEPVLCNGLRKKHVGMDVTANKGEYVFAADSGIVKTANKNDEWGGWITIEHQNALAINTTVYWHVIPSISEGELVEKGQWIGTIADLGTNTHFHFGVRIGNYAINTSDRGYLPSCEDPLVDPAFPENFIDPETIILEANNASQIDSDNDGFTKDNDCNDRDPSINLAQCDIRKDGIDQDCDGFDRTKGKPCRGGGDPVDTTEGKGQTCFDGLDNDKDGFTDCDDSDCSKKKNCSTNTTTTTSTTTTTTTTSTTVPNDENVCGNGICEQDESIFTCPADCKVIYTEF